MQTLKVAKTSRPTSVADAIAWAVRDEGGVQIEAVGAGAVNQATKAVAIARTYLSLEGIDIALAPVFTTVSVGDENCTALLMLVAPQAAAPPETERGEDGSLELAVGA